MPGYSGMEELVGKRVENLLVNEGENVLVFQTDNGDVAYEAWGDCCSETWFADITGVSGLLGQVVRKAESIEMPEVDDGRTRQDYDCFYGVRLTTDKATIDIVYRNSSNGYYGGWIEHQPKYKRTDDLREITGDWRA